MSGVEPESLRIPGKPSLHFLRWGSSGEPLLLLHGMGGNAYWWAKTAPRLAGQFQAVALDFRGHGDSDWPEDGRYDLEKFLEDIESARKYLGWSRMHIGAHSMGARVAVSYAQRWPDRLDRLAVIDFLPEFKPSMARKYRMAYQTRQPIYPSVEEMLPRFRLEPRLTFLEEYALKDLARHCIREAGGGFTWKFDWRCFRIHYDSAWPALSLLRTPVLVVRGARSDLMTPAIFADVVRAIPGAKGAEIPRAYHHVPLDAPEDLASRMRAFLLEKP